LNTIVTTKIHKGNVKSSEYSAQDTSVVTESPFNSSFYESKTIEGTGRQGPRLARDAPAGPPSVPLGSYRIINKNPQKGLIEERKLICAFKNYLKTTAQSTFIIHSQYSDCNTSPTSRVREVGYIHRWTAVYRDAVISKMYQLERWYQDNPCAVTMATFTTYQDGKYSQKHVGKYTINQAFRILKRSWNLVRMNLRYYSPELEFVYFYEPHKSGYPHLHVLFFGNLSSDVQNKIKLLWSEKYKAGSFSHGVKFDEIKNLKSVKNYVIKYMAKILRSDINAWTNGELYFNAIIWQDGFRLWGASQKLSKVMERQLKYVDADEAGYNIDELVSMVSDWTFTELRNEHGDTVLVRKKDGFTIPNEFLRG
jgi:hypothetical protein